MPAEIHRMLLHDETTFIDGGRAAATPMRLIAAAAVVTNPWAGRGFVENPTPEIRDAAPEIGERLVAMLVAAAGGGGEIEGYGKSSVVGIGGELEHSAAPIHYVPPGNLHREAVGAKTSPAFNDMRGGAGAPVMIPLMDKHDAGRGSHDLSIHFAISDASAPDEIIVALGASLSGRPHSRLADRYGDLQALGRAPQDPAGV